MLGKRLTLLAFGIAAVATALPCFGEKDAAKKIERVRPPQKWDAELDEVFSRDATSLRKGARPELRGSRPVPSEPGSGDTPSSETGGFQWSELISAETLTNEIKQAKIASDEHLRTPGVFKAGGNNEIRDYYSVVATMFAIIAEYDQEVRWQKTAAGARDLFARAGVNAKAADDATFREARDRNEDLAALMRGESIDVAEPNPDWMWHEVSEVTPLMRRLELAFDKRIRGWTAGKKEFDQHQEEILHEAELVAAIARMIRQEAFDNYDDDAYVAFCEALERGAGRVVDATKLGNLENAQAAAGDMFKACDACHADYR